MGESWPPPVYWDFKDRDTLFGFGGLSHSIVLQAVGSLVMDWPRERPPRPSPDP